MAVLIAFNWPKSSRIFVWKERLGRDEARRELEDSQFCFSHAPGECPSHPVALYGTVAAQGMLPSDVGVCVWEREKDMEREMGWGKGRDMQSEKCYFAFILQNSRFESKVKFWNSRD